jgi:hypothetical protein
MKPPVMVKSAISTCAPDATLSTRRFACELARHRLRRIPYIGLTHDQVRARRRRRDTPVQGRDTAAGVRAADYYAYAHAVAPAR